MRDIHLITSALFTKTIHRTQVYVRSLRMDSSHHDTVSRLPLVETPPSAIVRSLPYPRTIVVPALATDLSPLTSPLPRGSNGSTTTRTNAGSNHYNFLQHIHFMTNTIESIAYQLEYFSHYRMSCRRFNHLILSLH